MAQRRGSKHLARCKEGQAVFAAGLGLLALWGVWGSLSRRQTPTGQQSYASLVSSSSAKNWQQAVAGLSAEQLQGLAEQLQATQQALDRAEQQLQQREREAQQKDRELKEGESLLSKIWESSSTLFAGYSASVFENSLWLRRYLGDHSQELQGAWRAQLAGQRQRGIVIAAGGNYSVPLTNAFVTLYVIRRHLNSSLPAAIMFWGPAEPIPAALQAFFKAHLTNTEFVDASTLPYPQHHRPFPPNTSMTRLDGFALKAFALYAAPFREVLFLDADSHPLRDPAALFDTEEYLRHGNLFWPDCFVGDWGNRPVTGIYRLLKLDNPWASQDSQLRQTESGQFLWDRRRNWEALEWVLFANTHSDLIYRLVHGDKETFRLAFHLADRAGDFQQVAHPPAFLLSNLHLKGFLHFHPNGSVWIHHRTPGKSKHGQPAPLEPSTHLTARTSPELCSAVVSHWEGGGVFEDVGKQAAMLRSADCDYSVDDWPKAERNCAPWYSPELRDPSQRLPVFEVHPGSYLLAAQAAALKGFRKLEEEGPQG